MSTQVPRRDGFYFGKIGGDASQETIVKLEQNVVTNVFGRTYDLHLVNGTLIGEPIPTEAQCSTIRSLIAWRDSLMKHAAQHPESAVAAVLTAFPPPKE